MRFKKERDAWIKHVKQNRPKVVVMGPPCTHFGSFASPNSRYPGFVEGYEVSKDLADFAADIALIQLDDGRDFIAEHSGPHAPRAEVTRNKPIQNIPD